MGDVPNASLLLAAVSGQGWATVDDVPREAFGHLANEFGRLVGVSRVSYRVADRLVVTTAEKARPGTLSASYGDAGFPFHSDFAHRPVPPRYVLLRSPYRSSRPTLVLRAAHAISRIGDSGLRRGVWRVTKTAQPFACSVLFIAGDEEGFRFDQDCMVPLTRTAFDCDRELRRLLNGGAMADHGASVSWVPGRVVILDNWRVLHARGSRPDDETDGDRMLERIVLGWRGQ